jgi:hypothetical protein
MRIWEEKQGGENENWPLFRTDPTSRGAAGSPALLFDHGLLFLFDAITTDLDRRSAVTMVDHYDIFAHRDDHCRSRTR